MRILIDAMGGDNAPAAMLSGAWAALDCGAELVLVGDEPRLRDKAKALGVPADRFSFLHAPEVVTMEDDPVTVLRQKKQSSLVVGLQTLKEGGGDAFVSAGNTGALFAGATLLVGRAKGVKRAAIGTLLPGERPCLLLDAGANVTVTEEYLVQFAHLGAAYMRRLYGIDRPRVGLLNNGTEDCKGTPLLVETHRLLRQEPELNFVGNVEAGSVLFGGCDVVVTDGFSGNVLLKTLEGMGRYAMKQLKGVFTSGMAAKLGYLLVRDPIRGLRQTFDPSEHGGSPILGIARPVIKAHGSSDARAIQNAVYQALRCAGEEER